NCELLAAYMVHRGLGITVVAKQLKDPRINRALTDFRRNYGVEVILRDGRPEAGREVLRVLKQRRMLAVQLDMDVRVPSVSIPFSGRAARTPGAPAVLAVRGGVPALPMFIRRRPEGGHHVTIGAPILPPRTADRLRDVVELPRQCNQILEDQIRRSPAEW